MAAIDIPGGSFDSGAMLEITFIPALADNYIWLLHEGTDAVIVDPGDAKAVIWRLKAEGLNLKAILVTHFHTDHQAGLPLILENYPAPVFGPASESITGCSQPLSGGEVIELLGKRCQVLAIPGHTLGHLAYLFPGALFCGDTLFAGGCGRVFEGTPAQMVDSLAKLAALPDETLIYCGHEYTEANLRFAMAVEPGNTGTAKRSAEAAFMRLRGRPTVPSTLALEKATNPFLRCSEPAVIAAAQQRNPEAKDPVSVFATIREWKNEFC
ncbi:MAG: Hydroxyacylglutathione hydrolase [Betaproteobacteria bacterium ADurb.Bin341]|nr:MAG: Hydroxyacylglutathione hydrolase [Betaproteobacteria bacterium ADurb.Bin341]